MHVTTSVKNKHFNKTNVNPIKVNNACSFFKGYTLLF